MEKRNSAHNRAQRKGKERDLYICQICGAIIGLEGHHLIDYQFGGAANKENIITLCQECHRKAHNGRIDLIVF